MDEYLRTLERQAIIYKDLVASHKLTRIYRLMGIPHTNCMFCKTGNKLDRDSCYNCGSILNKTIEKPLTWKEVKKRYPLAAKELQKQIRSSRSINRTTPMSFFNWKISIGRLTQNGIFKPLYRITAGTNRFIRISSLYDDDTGQIVPGNWSF